MLIRLMIPVCLLLCATMMTAQTERHPALLKPGLAKETAPASYVVKMEFVDGAVVEVEVHRDWAPIAADRFYNLVKIGFFDGCAFFRVVKNFVVQWGIPADPAVTAAWKNQNLDDDQRKKGNALGTIAFASMMKPNTRTVQVFINTGNNVHLDSYGFAPFGKVIKGLDVVKGIYAGYGQRPDQTRIEREGSRYLDKEFPKLDRIKTATIRGSAPVKKDGGERSGAPVLGPPDPARRPDVVQCLRRLDKINLFLMKYDAKHGTWPRKGGTAFLMALMDEDDGVLERTVKDAGILFDRRSKPKADLSNVTPKGISFTGPLMTNGRWYSPSMRHASRRAIVAQKPETAGKAACGGFGICVLYAGGNTEFIRSSEFPGGKIVIGPKSPLERLRTLDPDH